VFTDFVDVSDVGMIERCCRLSLANEPSHPFFLQGEIRGKYFESNLAIERSVFGKIDLAHSAHSEL
jgi:hypothetical protein